MNPFKFPEEPKKKAFANCFFAKAHGSTWILVRTISDSLLLKKRKIPEDFIKKVRFFTIICG